MVDDRLLLAAEGGITVDTLQEIEGIADAFRFEQAAGVVAFGHGIAFIGSTQYGVAADRRQTRSVRCSTCPCESIGYRAAGPLTRPESTPKPSMIASSLSIRCSSSCTSSMARTSR